MSPGVKGPLRHVRGPLRDALGPVLRIRVCFLALWHLLVEDGKIPRGGRPWKEPGRVSLLPLFFSAGWTGSTSGCFLPRLPTRKPPDAQRSWGERTPEAGVFRSGWRILTLQDKKLLEEPQLLWGRTRVPALPGPSSCGHSPLALFALETCPQHPLHSGEPRVRSASFSACTAEPLDRTLRSSSQRQDLVTTRKPHGSGSVTSGTF